MEDALYEAAKERAVDLEKEEREEDLEDCEEVSGLLKGGGRDVCDKFSGRSLTGKKMLVNRLFWE